MVSAGDLDLSAPLCDLQSMKKSLRYSELRERSWGLTKMTAAITSKMNMGVKQVVESRTRQGFPHLLDL